MTKMHPFLGRMKVKIIIDDTKEYLDKKVTAETGVSSDFMKQFEVVYGEDVIDNATGQKKFQSVKGKKQVNKGTVIEMSPDCFGKSFQERYGNDREYPKLGDTVMFIPNKSCQIDAENQYHIVDENDIVGYIKAEETVNG